MKIVLPKPDDWHVHLRQGELMPFYVRDHAKAFGRVLAMPNTKPPLGSVETIRKYQLEADAVAPNFCVLPAFYLMPTMKEKDINNLADAGILAGKYYPAAVTTNSEGGLSHWRQAEKALAAMEERDIVLCIHGERPDAPVMDRECAFLPEFREIRRNFPKLRMVLEHVSTAAGVRMILDDPGPSVATVTIQHLALTLDDLLAGLLQPHMFCKPILKFKEDRQAIQDVVFSANPRFFFGSDSAPHPRNCKESASCPAGIYSAPMALPALATIFEKAQCLDALKSFVCDFGRRFYKVSSNIGETVLLRKPWTVPKESGGCVPLMAGESLPWQVLRENN